MFKTIQNSMYGKKRFQPLFEKLYYFAKFGRNIGLPIDVNSSGEINFIQLLGRMFKDRDHVVFFDIGANHGVYTRNVLKFSPPNTNCYLFEPQEILCKELRSTFANNSNVTIVGKACGSKPERADFFLFENIDTLGSLYNSFKGKQSESCTKVDVIRLEDYLNENSIQYLDLIKIDVEGHELQVLKGLSGYLAQKKINVIQFEFGSFNIISRTFFKDFWEMLHNNYDIYRILKDGLFKIRIYSPHLEIFDTTNYAAIAKRNH